MNLPAPLTAPLAVPLTAMALASGLTGAVARAAPDGGPHAGPTAGRSPAVAAAGTDSAGTRAPRGPGGPGGDRGAAHPGLDPRAPWPLVAPSPGAPRQGAPGQGAPRLSAPSLDAPSPTGHRWAWPMEPRPPVLRLFARPAREYGRGHRGIDLGGRAGVPVRAVADGTVVHVGVVAGRGTVTLLHAAGLRSTYEPVSASVRRGQTVQRGAVLGRLATEGSHCPPAACLHLGARSGSEYLDPLPLLEDTGVRLLPLR